MPVWRRTIYLITTSLQYPSPHQHVRTLLEQFLGPVCTKRHTVLVLVNASDTVLIEINRVAQKWVATLNWSDATVFSENSIAKLSQH